jgi:hypothetical protein
MRQTRVKIWVCKRACNRLKHLSLDVILPFGSPYITLFCLECELHDFTVDDLFRYEIFPELKLTMGEVHIVEPHCREQ